MLKSKLLKTSFRHAACPVHVTTEWLHLHTSGLANCTAPQGVVHQVHQTQQSGLSQHPKLLTAAPGRLAAAAVALAAGLPLLLLPLQEPPPQTVCCRHVTGRHRAVAGVLDHGAMLRRPNCNPMLVCKCYVKPCRPGHRAPTAVRVRMYEHLLHADVQLTNHTLINHHCCSAFCKLYKTTIIAGNPQQEPCKTHPWSQPLPPLLTNLDAHAI